MVLLSTLWVTLDKSLIWTTVSLISLGVRIDSDSLKVELMMWGGDKIWTREKMLGGTGDSEGWGNALASPTLLRTCLARDRGSVGQLDVPGGFQGPWTNSCAAI